MAIPKGVVFLETNPCSETNMWRAVISQLFMDLASKHYHHQAKQWVLEETDDFMMVCELAKIDPSSLRLVARQLLSKINH